MKFRHVILLLVIVIISAGVFLVKTIHVETAYTRPDISTFVYWEKNPTLDMVKKTVQARSEINEPSEYGFTPLMFAVDTGNPHIVRFLIQSGAWIDATARADESTALIQSVKRSQDTTVIKVLLEFGADIMHKDDKGKTAYDYALQNPDLQNTDIIPRLKP